MRMWRSPVAICGNVNREHPAIPFSLRLNHFSITPVKSDRLMAGAHGKSAVQGLGTTKSRLRNLLKYTDELLSFNEKVVFDLAREHYPHFHEFEVAAQEGVETALDDEIWLQIHRLRETRPPDCAPIFGGWVDFGPH